MARSPKPSHPPRPSPIIPRSAQVHPSPCLPRTNLTSISSAPQTACKHAMSVATGRSQPTLARDAVAALALHHASSSASITSAPATVGISVRRSLHVVLRRRCWQMLDPPQSLHTLLWRLCWQMLDPPQSLHLFLRRLCWQMLDPPHSLHWLLWRRCWQMLDLPHSLHKLLMRGCWQKLAPPHSLHWLLWRRCWQMLDPPHSLHLFLRHPCWQMLDPPRSLHKLLLRWCWHIPVCAACALMLWFFLILRVGVSCSTQSCQPPPRACASLCRLCLPRQPSSCSFPPPCSVCNLSTAASSPSLKRTQVLLGNEFSPQRCKCDGVGQTFNPDAEPMTSVSPSDATRRSLPSRGLGCLCTFSPPPALKR